MQDIIDRQKDSEQGVPVVETATREPLDPPVSSSRRKQPLRLAKPRTEVQKLTTSSATPSVNNGRRWTLKCVIGTALLLCLVYRVTDMNHWSSTFRTKSGIQTSNSKSVQFERHRRRRRPSPRRGYHKMNIDERLPTRVGKITRGSGAGNRIQPTHSQERYQHPRNSPSFHSKEPWDRLRQPSLENSAVTYARLHRLPQRINGLPRATWNVLTTSTCQDEEASTSQSSFIPIQQSLRDRLPFAILIGAQKAGTTALYSYLDAHPNIAHSKKELYFLDEHVDRIMFQSSSLPSTSTNDILNKNKKNQTLSQPSIGIPRRDIQIAYAKYLDQSLLKDDETRPNPKIALENQEQKQFRMDSTPNYIFGSDRIPARIMCVVPWVKVLVLLRNPIDRALSQYKMKLRFIQKKYQNNEFGYPFPTFDEYVQADIDALYETGVLQDWSKIDFATFSGSKQEQEAWNTYIHSGLNAPVGMGLYSIALKHFLDEFEKNQKPKSDFLAISSDDLNFHTNATYTKVLDFLGLPNIALSIYPRKNQAQHQDKQESSKSSQEEMSTHTRQLLTTIFEPYNRQLEVLLGKDWEGIWT